MTWFLTTRLGRALAGAGALLLAVLAYGAAMRRKGATAARDKLAEQSRRKTDEGEDAYQDEYRNTRGADADDLLDRLRKNDGDWRGL